MNHFVKSVRCMLGFGAALAVWLSLVGCVTPGDPVAQPRNAPPTLDGTPGSDVSIGSDLLRPGDVVIIGFSGVSDPPARVDDRIREDGRIVLPFVGPIDAAGLTRSELQTKIREAYVPKYYRQLTVSVNPDTRYIYVDGEVKRPGNYPYSGQMSVSKSIAAAGGFTDFARRNKIQLIRQGSSRPIIVNWDKAQRNSKLDEPVYPEDRIYVPRRWF